MSEQREPIPCPYGCGPMVRSGDAMAGWNLLCRDCGVQSPPSVTWEAAETKARRLVALPDPTKPYEGPGHIVRMMMERFGGEWTDADPSDEEAWDQGSCIGDSGEVYHWRPSPPKPRERVMEAVNLLEAQLDANDGEKRWLIDPVEGKRWRYDAEAEVLLNEDNEVVVLDSCKWFYGWQVVELVPAEGGE